MSMAWSWWSCPPQTSVAASAELSPLRTPIRRPRCWPTKCATSWAPARRSVRLATAPAWCTSAVGCPGCGPGRRPSTWLRSWRRLAGNPWCWPAAGRTLSCMPDPRRCCEGRFSRAEPVQPRQLRGSEPVQRRQLRGAKPIQQRQLRAHREAWPESRRVGLMSAPVMLGMPGLPPTSPRGVGNLRGDEKFPVAARHALADTQLRRNLGKATGTIRAKRAQVVSEVSDWEELRAAGRQLKVHTMARLPEYLVQFEEAVA